MALSPKDFLTSQDMEDFARSFLRLDGSDSDLFYESYYNLDNDNDGYEEEEYREEMNNSYTY